MGSPAEPGLMSQSIEDLFSMCDAKKDHEFLCRMSYIEIYNEEVRQPQPSRKRCTIDYTYVLLHILYVYYTYSTHMLLYICPAGEKLSDVGWSLRRANVAVRARVSVHSLC